MRKLEYPWFHINNMTTDRTWCGELTDKTVVESFYRYKACPDCSKAINSYFEG